MKTLLLTGTAWMCLVVVAAQAGNYSKGKDDPGNIHDAPIPGFVGPAGLGKAPINGTNQANYVNPAFQGWATEVVSYAPADDIPWEETPGDWFQPARALGPVTGDDFHVVSLNDLTEEDLDVPKPPGRITLGFAAPIYNGPGPDFAIFENAFAFSNLVFAELGYVEVSSDGMNFARFPSSYGNTGTVRQENSYRFQDPTNIYNLAGKHLNSAGESWGTPFDLAQVAGNPLVDVMAIRYVRIVDIPGSGDFVDSAGQPIFDSWVTVGSGGLDLEAIGVLHQQRTYENWARAAFGLSPTAPLPDPAGDADGDGRPEALEYAEQSDPLVYETPAPQLAPGLVGEGSALELRWRYWRDPRATAAGLDIRAQVAESPGNWSTGAEATALYGLIEEAVPGAVSGPHGEVLWQARVPVAKGQSRYLNLEVTIP